MELEEVELENVDPETLGALAELGFNGAGIEGAERGRGASADRGLWVAGLLAVAPGGGSVAVSGLRDRVRSCNRGAGLWVEAWRGEVAFVGCDGGWSWPSCGSSQALTFF